MSVPIFFDTANVTDICFRYFDPRRLFHRTSTGALPDPDPITSVKEEDIIAVEI